MRLKWKSGQGPRGGGAAPFCSPIELGGYACVNYQGSYFRPKVSDMLATYWMAKLNCSSIA